MQSIRLIRVQIDIGIVDAPINWTCNGRDVGSKGQSNGGDGHNVISTASANASELNTTRVTPPGPLKATSPYTTSQQHILAACSFSAPMGTTFFYETRHS